MKPSNSQTSKGHDILSTKLPKYHLTPSPLNTDLNSAYGHTDATIQEKSTNAAWSTTKTITDHGKTLRFKFIRILSKNIHEQIHHTILILVRT
ncbi:unknown [Prevotella sp. CAG:1124]|nr:unknown [Prevotella sp. CAG:1124]